MCETAGFPLSNKLLEKKSLNFQEKPNFEYSLIFSNYLSWKQLRRIPKFIRKDTVIDMHADQYILTTKTYQHITPLNEEI